MSESVCVRCYLPLNRAPNADPCEHCGALGNYVVYAKGKFIVGMDQDKLAVWETVDLDGLPATVEFLRWLLAEARWEAEHYRDHYDAGSSMISEGYARSRLPWETR